MCITDTKRWGVQSYIVWRATPFAWRRKGLGTSAYATRTGCRNIADQSDCLKEPYQPHLAYTIQGVKI